MKNEEIEQAISEYLASKELVLMSYPPEYIEDVKTDMEVAFRKGAEWMAGQGYTKEGIARPDDCEIWVNMTGTDINDGDEVVVQIRKK